VPVSYVETSEGRWLEAFKAFEWSSGQIGGDFRGKCPSCEHPMTIPYEPHRGRWQTSVFKTLDQPDKPKLLRGHEVLVRCNCTYDHEGRPKDVTRGCGARGVAIIHVGSSRA
jgi:hypothetical protein